MSTFAPVVNPPQEKLPDPTKHVNFTNGMVLGVDEFEQEFAYLEGRDQWMARDLIGYGTVCGLRVGPQTIPSRGVRIDVEQGAALSPRGQLIRVPKAQCAYLDDWWAEHQSEVTPDRVVDNAVRVAVTLCYRDCETDWLPQPGEPCRTEEETAAATRIKDDYLLELRWQAPEQREEDALRDFAAWLREIEVSETTPADQAADLLAFEEAIRAALISGPTSPPGDFLSGSPPEGLRIPQGLSCEYLRAAFRIWTTELRPRWNSAAAEAEAANPDVEALCCGVAPMNECVLLGEVVIPVVQDPSGVWMMDSAGEVVVDQERRPFVLHLRMLQEWMVCGRVVTPGDTVVAETSFGLLDDPGVSERYSRADHTHGTPALPELAGDVTGPIEDNRIAAIQGTPVSAEDGVSSDLQAGQALALVDTGDGALVWQPVAPGGDVTGPLDENTLSAIQGTPVNAVNDPSGSLAAGDALALVDTGDGALAWQPVSPGGDVTGPLDENMLSAIQGTPVSAGNDPSTNLQLGQALTLVDTGDGALEWQPVALDGDVIGAVDDNTVSAIQDVPVVYPDGSLAAGRVLKLVDGAAGLEWQPADDQAGGDLPDLGGDVTGVLEGNQVSNLQTVPLVYPDDSLAEGRVLTLVNVGDEVDVKLVWQPGRGSAGGPFVEHPVRFGRYEIAAAGWVEFAFSEGQNSPNSRVRAPYGRLELLGTEFFPQLAGMHSLTFNFQFSGYQERFNDDLPYVIKVTPWVIPAGKFSFTAAVSDINPEFFQVVVSFHAVDQTEYTGRIQLEVSQYEPDGGGQ